VFSRTRNVRQRGLQMTLLALEAVVAIALCFVGYAVTTG